MGGNNMELNTLECGKEKVKQALLTSLNPEKYPNTSIECLIMENPEKELSNFVDTTQPPIMAKKSCTVGARRAVLGEKVITGPIVDYKGNQYRFDEATRVVGEKDIANGAMIVKNPDGEMYLVNENKFLEQYGEIQNGGQKVEAYAAQGAPKPFQKATASFCIPKPSWGEGVYQYVLEGSMVNVEKPNNPTAITNVAFDNTYGLIEPPSVEKI
jgi:hypothetical protein